MRITRRTFGTGALSLGLAGTLGRVAAAAPVPTGDMLARDLNARLATNPAGARFGVTEFAAARVQGAEPVALSAAVRLDWAPGVRLRRLEARGGTETAAYAALLHLALAEFAGVVPGLAGPDAQA